MIYQEVWEILLIYSGTAETSSGPEIKKLLEKLPCQYL
jgi:hypothetical protein